MEHNKLKKIGFIFGLKREMELVLNKNNNIYYAYGYGKSSKDATHKLINQGVNVVINFGFAGSISKKLKNGDVVFIDKIFNEKNKKLSTSKIDKDLMRNFEIKFKFFKCNLLTVQEVAMDKREKLNLAKKFKSISLIDMEAYHIKEELLKENIPMISLKVIFDDLSFNIPSYLKNCITDAGNLRIKTFLIQLCLNPTRIFELLKLNTKFLKSEKVLRNLINSL